MTYQDPTPPEEPSSRLAGRMPWILLGIGGLAILAVIGAILAMRRGGDQVNVSVAAQSTSTPAVVGVPVTVVITATSVPPTQGFPTLIVPTQTPQAEVIVTPVPKAPPATAAVVAPPPGAPPVGASGETGAQTNPTSVPAPTLVQPTVAPAPPTTAPPTAAATPTTQPFRGEVSPSGGLANSRASFDGAYGAPTGETPSRLVVYQRQPREYQVLFSPDPARALLVVARVAANAPMTLESARDAARSLLPNDAQRRTTQPEGNESFVVERYHSSTLEKAIPAETAREWSGEPGDLIVIYQKASGAADRIDRIIVAIGDNVDRARQRAGT
jgi:hypothetical protein